MPAEVRISQRRDQFLEAGLELFGTLGFRATSVRAICRQAGLSERYFYESFANTEALLIGVYQRYVETMGDEILVALATGGQGADATGGQGAEATGGQGAEATGGQGAAASSDADVARPDVARPGIADASGDPMEHVARTTLEAFFASVRDPRVLRVCWLEVLGVSAAVDATYIAGIDRFAEMVAMVLSGRLGLARDERLRLVATALVGAVMTTAIRWYLDGQQEPISTLVDANTMLFVGVATQLGITGLR